MKKCIYFLVSLLFFSCDKIPGVNNIALPPESSNYSEKQGLLVEKYTYPKDTINLLGDNYLIADAWVSHNFKNRTSKEINLDYLVFFCSFKNIKTNEYFIDQTKGDIFAVLEHNIDSYGHGFEGLGKKYSHYSIFFKDKNIENLPDTIKIFVKNRKETKELNFYKY